MIKFFKTNYLIVLLAILLICVIVLSAANFLPAAAQSPDEPWDPPVNLSHSGATTHPIMLVDSNGTVHVIWEDEFAGWVYTESGGDQWSLPLIGDLPFTSSDDPSDDSYVVYPPLLVSDSNGRIHAFWTDEEDVLSYSSVESSSFNDALSWQAPLQIAQSALDIDVTIDSQGNMHLTYVRTLDDGIFPAGIYYRYLINGGLEWSQSVILYQSQYFRSLTREDANVGIATADSYGSSHVYVTWDNRPRKRIYIARSNDSGQTWDTPLEIDNPDSTTGLGTPFNIQVNADGEESLLVWQTGEPDASCTQNYRWSTDGGDNWSETQVMLEDLFGCPQENYLFNTSDGLTLLMTTIQDQIYLLAWDGTQWSEPQAQRVVSGFEDPDTYAQVVFRCRQPDLTSDDNLLMVGCDEGEGGDIWFTSRPLGTVDDWFPPPQIWSSPTTLSSSSSEISSPVLVSDLEGSIHAFWIQTDEASSSGDETAIYYARWDGEGWSRPSAVLHSPIGAAENPSAALDMNGRLLVVWNGNQSGEIYFSWADASRANNALEWAEPMALPSLSAAVISQDILVDGDRIFVVYAIPLNEHRGIYLTSSVDGGKSWTDPVQIYDGVAAGSEMVSEPRLARTRDGRLHVIWTRYSLPGGVGPLSLYYAVSEDGGITWSEADLVVESSVFWSEVAGTGERTLHRMWLEETSGRQVFQHQYSQDSGLTWIRPAGIATFGDILGQPGLTQDVAGNLHLQQIIESSDGKPEIQHWTWDGERWLVDEALPLTQEIDFEGGALGVSVSPAGDLGITFNGSRLDPIDELPVQELYFSNRTVEVSEPLSAPAPLPSVPTEIPAPTIQPTPRLTHIPVEPIPAERPQSGIIPLNNSFAGVIIASVLAIIAVVAVFGLYMLVVRGRR